MNNIQDVLHLNDILDEKISLAFSGGVDSSLLAKLVNLQEFDLPLVSVSFGEHDDLEYIKKAAEILGGEHYYLDIPLSDLEKGLTHTLETIKYDRIALLENALGYYFIFKLASHNGFDTVLSAHGVDELYCGYDVFRRQLHKTDINKLIVELTETAKQDKYEIDKIAEIFDITYLCPFLDDAFIEFSKAIPLSQKIIDKNDVLRKHYIRCQAIRLGLPEEIAYNKKRSLQYSSGLHKAIRRLARKRGYTNKKGKTLGYESGLKAYITSLIIS